MSKKPFRVAALTPRQRYILRSTLGYTLFAAAWIFLSDRILNAFTDMTQLTMFGTVKGLVFVGVTTVLLYFGLQNVPQKDHFSLPSETLGKISPHRFILALLLPLFATAIQWALWEEIQPYVWFLFFPTVFLSSWLGGLLGGILATAISVVMIWYVFLPTAFSFTLEKPGSIIFMGIFFGMGVLFSFMHERLRLSERHTADTKFRALVEQSLAGIYILQGENFRYVNQAFADIFGYASPAEIIGKVKLSELIAEPDRPSVQRNMMGNAKNISSECQSTCIGLRQDGTPVHLEIRGRTAKYDGQPAAIGLFMDISDRVQAEQSLRRMERESAALARRHQILMHNALDGIHIMNLQGQLIDANEAFCQMLGYTMDEVLKLNVTDWDAQWSADELRIKFQELIGKKILIETLHRRKDGSLIDVEINVSHLELDGQHYIYASSRDITERKLAERRLTQAATVFETTREGVVVTDADNRIIMVNRAFCQISGYTESEILGNTPAMLNSGRQDKEFYREMWANLATLGYWQGEIWNRRKNGEIYPELLSISTVKNQDGQLINYVAVFADISQIKSSEAKLEFLAHHDPLTQLPNRLLFQSRLEHSINQAKRSNTRLALLMLDLDRFKDVNDSFGHIAGDKLLQQVAEHLRSRLRETDTVARLGGDEFTLLMENITHPEDAAHLSDEIIHAFNTAWTLPEGIEVHIGASVGISIYPEHGSNADELLQHADTALYQAKAAGRGNFKYFSEDMTRSARERMEIELGLRHALQNNELRVYYQPQINIADGCIIGAEALIRWQHPTQGLISPIRFIPVAEITGLIAPIGAWVMKETCLQGQRWIQAGFPSLTLAVNLSPYQFIHSDIEETVSQVLAETGFPADQLELELTESALMERDDDVVGMLHRLRKLGVRLAIDDFGTGYSSLAYLKSFPLDVLKIDKRFVDDIPTDQDDMEIAATIIAMGHTLGFNVLAEGVEKPEQLEFLRSHGCDLYQGYLTSPPIPAEDFAKLLASHIGRNIPV